MEGDGCGQLNAKAKAKGRKGEESLSFWLENGLLCLVAKSRLVGLFAMVSRAAADAKGYSTAV